VKISIDLPAVIYNDLKQHLFPMRASRPVEESAFLFALIDQNAESLILRYADHQLVKPADYVTRSAYHLELRDEIRGQIIVKAHNLQATIIEVHSHVRQHSAQFSETDWLGFAEFVPHVMWRLKGKPYAAVVFADDTFDSLVWCNRGEDPRSLDYLAAGTDKFFPTNNSIQNLKWY
jgi:hypothetical protein